MIVREQANAYGICSVEGGRPARPMAIGGDAGGIVFRRVESSRVNATDHDRVVVAVAVVDSTTHDGFAAGWMFAPARDSPPRDSCT